MAIDPAASIPSSLYPLLAKSRQLQHFWHSSRSVATLLSLAAPLLLLVATRADGTFAMDGESKGFSQHYGFWVIFVTTPAIILLTGHLLDRFVEVLRKPEDYLSTGADATQTQQLHTLVEREIESLCLRSKARFILHFCILVGLMYYILNVIKTYAPNGTYGHDVFDSWRHASGYLSTKIYLLPIFTMVYPIALFVAGHVTFSMVRVLRFLCKNDILQISFFHQDNCGGTSCFGEINALIMGIYALLIGVIAGMFLTHERTYFVTQSALVFCSVACVLQSVWGVWAIHTFVQIKKRLCLQEITKRLNRDLSASLNSSDDFRDDLLAARNHIATIHTFPYATRVAFIVNSLRFAPVALALVTFAKS